MANALPGPQFVHRLVQLQIHFRRHSTLVSFKYPFRLHLLLHIPPSLNFRGVCHFQHRVDRFGCESKSDSFVSTIIVLFRFPAFFSLVSHGKKLFGQHLTGRLAASPTAPICRTTFQGFNAYAAFHFAYTGQQRAKVCKIGCKLSCSWHSDAFVLNFLLTDFNVPNKF